MSKADTTEAGSWIDRVPRTPRPEQTPWLTAEDARGWTRIGRGRGKGKPPRISVQVDLNDDQSAWLRAAAKRAGLDYGAFLERLVEDARARSVATPG